MTFELWSIWHILYILSPIIVMLILYFSLRKASEKTKYIVGVIIGTISIGILIMRNVDIYLTVGFDPEIIPLQVCHFGNIMVLIALVFKSKIATSILWTLNVLAAFASLIFADALTGYATIFCIRAQAYIWGHLFIVVGGLYAVLMKIVRIDLKSFLLGLGVLVILLIPAIVLNSYFNDVLGYNINYFYIYNSDGVPFEFLYIGERAQYGWFTINWIYTLSVVGIFIVLMFGIFNLQKLLYLKDKDYQTHNIFHK
ncbi:MAG: hypothetical protein ACI4R8_03265 [Candidatus Caccovivens sp.]